MHDRRQTAAPTDLIDYLHELPALKLLDRLPIAMLAVALHGDIIYANQACADMLGYIDGATVARQPLPELLTDFGVAAPAECVERLRTKSASISWNHTENYAVQTRVSPPLLVRSTDPVLLISIIDLTEWIWG
ncbi:PAS domain-containing protein [Mycolicibacterium arenosum]|uniref:PAS domain-containing protein n=1 Tax=Mycolicibacterium arenosum TaxID=2952157 RepID=A0ABT1MDG3_9MYCO|nr:PAS domain-containing protein [Mycolicibacterium sp. CAU 1645]MCP9275832.1 PAS domain-containing protein [Mycolicibacterium sp. CAU 1645]